LVRLVLLVAASVSVAVALMASSPESWRRARVDIVLMAVIAFCVLVVLPLADASPVAFRFLWALVFALALAVVIRVIVMISGRSTMSTKTGA
jgi:hypothetical protein